jgi:hypothetical protein
METQKCTLCQNEHDSEDLIFFQDSLLCQSCLDSETVICRRCSERIWVNDAEDEDLCQHCFDNYYVYCSDCGRVVHNDDTYYEEEDDYSDNPFCYDCYNNRTRVINNYSYKPEPIFFGAGIFYGIELEIDRGGENNENAEILQNIANSKYDHIYIKRDGSIDDGFELVSHPMSLEYHTNEMAWKELLRKAVSLGYYSHNTTTCGLHIHCNKSAFGETLGEQEQSIARIVYFFEKFWDNLLKFSRRTEAQVNRWATRYGLKNSPKENLEYAKDKRHGRYVAVNLQNFHTVEFRLFRGTLKYETFIATLQLVDEICNVAFSMSDKAFQHMRWKDFVKNIKGKQELLNYIEMRGIK